MSDDRFGYGEIGMDTSHCADATAYAMMCKPKSITNADRIRSMTDEELAKKMSGLESFALTCGGGWPPEKWFDWLKEEVSDGV